MTPEQIWQAVLAELELTLSKANFTTWFKNTFIGSYENDDVVICVPGVFYKKWLEDKFHPNLLKLVEKTIGKPIRSLIYRVETRRSSSHFTQNSISGSQPAVNNQEVAQISEKITETPVAESVNAFGLNPRYVFDNFVVGKGNELGHAASLAVVAKPGRAYNPLYIYGGPGLGKTHLLQAIGNQLLRQNSIKKVIYVTCEKFTNEFIHSVQTGKAKNFQDNYRNTDLLLIDDIQFISNKKETQESFFHTFNALHQADKQVVISSDCPPKAIRGLEDRLRSRFEMGMIADIASPDFETRVAILQQKCQEKECQLEKDIITLIASLVQNNVRELEGALNKISAYFQLRNTLPDENTIRSLVATYENSASRKIITPKVIIQTVTEYYDIKIEEVLSPKRDKRLAYPRQIIMFLMREEIKSSFPTIGDELGGRDHTTAMHACRKIKNEVEKNYKAKEEISQIKQRLYAIA